jgi:NitT/TauT family transport system ATP-binding protein
VGRKRWRHPNAVEVIGVDKIFNAGKSGEVGALKGIDLSVRRVSSCRSSARRAVARARCCGSSPTSPSPVGGHRLVNGKSAKQSRLDQDYGMAFQQAGLFEWRSVAKNIELPLELKGWDKAKRRARALEMLELVKLPDFADSHAVAAVGWHAAARRHRPCPGGAPAAAADGRAVRRARRDDPRAHAGRTAAHLRRDHTTVIFVTHSIPEAVYLSTAWS